MIHCQGLHISWVQKLRIRSQVSHCCCCCTLLLQPVLPMRVNGRQLAPDELAVCDLCDSDEEGAAAPKWGVQKKQLISVDV